MMIMMKKKIENENLHNELEDLSQEHTSYMTNAEHEFELMNQKVQNLEKALQESKTNLDNEAAKNKLNIENMNDLFNSERREFQSKIDNISSDLNNKEKELTTLNSKKEQLEKIINDKDDLINQIKDENVKEREENSLKYEELRKK